MTEQLFYEDIDIGTEVTPLAKIATTAMLVKFAGASGDFNPLHYDAAFATAHRVGEPIVHGALKRQWLVQLIIDWIGEEGSLKKLACYHLAMDYPRHMKTSSEPEEGETWWCKGKVTSKYKQAGDHYVECEIWVENGKGRKTSPGKATVILPSREYDFRFL